jgi:hypothetical protein
MIYELLKNKELKLKIGNLEGLNFEEKIWRD